MRIFHFKNQRKSQFLFKVPNATEISGAGNLVDWLAPKLDKGKWGEERDALRNKINGIEDDPNHPRPHPVIPARREDLKKRLQKEIFESQEIQDYYVNEIEIAFDSINQQPINSQDVLYEFIKGHNPYKKKDFEEWNKHLRTLMLMDDIDRKYQGKTEEKTNQRVAAALQIYLVDYYKNDVFQVNQKNRANPWIHIDGKNAAYTNSVLAEYWNYRYYDSNNEKRPKLKHTELADTYKEGSQAKKLYAQALAWLVAQVANSHPDEVIDDKGAQSSRENLKKSVSKKQAVIKKYKELSKNNNDGFDKLEIGDWIAITKGQKGLLQILKKAYPNNKKRAYRAMYLLSLGEMGEKVDSIQLKENDTLKITKDGKLLINYKKDNGRTKKIAEYDLQKPNQTT